MSRVIVHLDADAFFAAVEQAADPKLRGKPIAVGGLKRGIIASASYEARKFGVYTPMPTVRARKLCPKLIVLPGDFERYEQFSNWMFAICYDFTPDVEQTSIDEGYFDLSNTRKSPVEIALTIRRAIGQSLKIVVNEGIASNKLVSAIASKLNKPSAFKEVRPGGESAFLNPLPNKWLPGIGPKTSLRLNTAGLAQICQIAATPLEMLELLLGNQAAGIRQFAHGIDDRLLIPAREPQKSFSQQETFGSDLTDEEYIEATLRRMADNLFAKVREEGRSIRTLTVKVRYNDMAEDQVAESLLEPTDLETDIYGRLHAMLGRAWKRRLSLRLVSLKLSNVYDGHFRSELPLEVSAQRQEACAQVALVIDELRKAWGHGVILRGHDFILRSGPRESLIDQEITRKKSSPQIITREKRIDYVPLRCHGFYSFLDSTLSPAAIVQLAKQYELSAVALTDTGNLHGVVEFVQAAQAAWH
jgi:nucleotidyltransferase/DNA polymerase involved in DNA repair